MGLGLSNLTKSPLERRNTVARRSQRKSIHQVKAKTNAIFKDIKKFKGTTEDVAFAELRTRIENTGIELLMKNKDLQPQLKNVYQETRKLLEDCSQYLVDKLKENQENAKKKAEEEAEAAAAAAKEEKAKHDSVIVEEIEEEQEPEQEQDETKEKRKSVQLKVVQIASPKDKRESVVRMGGVAVMPGSFMDQFHAHQEQLEDDIEEIRKEIANIEETISQFVGKKNGKYYKQIKDQLEQCATKLTSINDNNDEDVIEKIKRCLAYIDSCSTFLDEKSSDDYDDVFETQPPLPPLPPSQPTSPRLLKMTQI